MDLFKLSAAMRKKRYEDGALSLNSIKLSFTLNDDGKPIGVSVFEAKEANKLVEEFMLLANISVAQKVWESYPSCSLLRRHECPIERRLVSHIHIVSVIIISIENSHLFFYYYLESIFGLDKGIGI